jgi:magnesium transporter
MKMIYYDKENDRINYEQVSFVFGTNFLITFQEFEGDAFTDVRRRLQNNSDIIRSKGTDYLTFALVNAIIDGYYSVLDVFTDAIEDLEIELSQTESTDPQLQRQFHLMRNEIMLLHRAVQPLLGIASKLNNYTGTLIPKVNKKYISDISDHINQISETITSQREILASLQDIYMANINQKMNEVMKTLTLVTTIFIPLSFIVGVYGMNFDYMPELKHPWGYFIVWGIMLTIVAGMLLIFRRKKWF